MKNVIVSQTAEQHGFGSDPYKWVSHMTKEERHLVKQGGTVLFASSRLSGGNNGTFWRKVKYAKGRYFPRVPDKTLVASVGLVY